MRKRKWARIGTYYNGHNSKLIDKLNEVLKDVKDDTIVEELFVNYFDDKEIDGIIEFFEDRFINQLNKWEYKTCDRCSYDILDEEGDVLEHHCIDDEQ